MFVINFTIEIPDLAWDDGTAGLDSSLCWHLQCFGSSHCFFRIQPASAPCRCEPIRAVKEPVSTALEYFVLLFSQQGEAQQDLLTGMDIHGGMSNHVMPAMSHSDMSYMPHHVKHACMRICLYVCRHQCIYTALTHQVVVRRYLFRGRQSSAHRTIMNLRLCLDESSAEIYRCFSC